MDVRVALAVADLMALGHLLILARARAIGIAFEFTSRSDRPCECAHDVTSVAAVDTPHWPRSAIQRCYH